MIAGLCASICHIGGLTLALVAVLTPQKSANATDQGLICCFVDCLDMRQ